MAIMPSITNVEVREREVRKRKSVKVSTDKSKSDPKPDLYRGVGGRYVIKDGVRVPREED